MNHEGHEEHEEMQMRRWTMEDMECRVWYSFLHPPFCVRVLFFVLFVSSWFIVLVSLLGGLGRGCLGGFGWLGEIVGGCLF